ncbi:MAG: glycoside hydrolase family 2 [Bacteroidales bacterium]|jgi:beta-galactosidase|nr:glycoside hydrolase family 2 [Bacteroidales bacterium]
MRKIVFSVFILFVCCFALFSQQTYPDKLNYPYVFAPSEGYISKVEKPFRKEICLNGSWDFQSVPLPGDYQRGKGVAPALPQPVSSGWDKVKIKIPSPWNINSFANRNLEGPDHRNYPSYPEEWNDVRMAWMRRSVQIPADWNECNIGLHFEAVAGFTEVYVNGRKVAENFDLFLPFDADITPYVKAGQNVEILVGVRSQSLFEDNSTKGRRIVPAGSMWGYHIAGIWQDVFLTAVPSAYISNVFVKPSVSASRLELDVEITNTGSKEVKTTLKGNIYEWINQSGTDVNSAPVPDWELAGSSSLSLVGRKITIPAKRVQKITVSIPVKEGDLKYWTPEHPNLYGLMLTLNDKKVTDVKYERFGWREWTFDGTRQLLNGKPFELRGDSWHFMGVPQMTRRYAWAWFTALKDINANAVRPHAQVYPRFYLDMADEMGICVLAETAIWASDGGPKMDSPVFWENCKEHIRRMVLRDRNHASVFGWSVSNENKPVILHVFNKPEWMDMQKKAWADWRDIVRENDPTRPWISSDGEDDGDGILPTTVGHYGDNNSMKRWEAIGKPWGIGEHSMAYYGTPEQVSKYNGERAYESQLGRMEGLAYECYDLIARQRIMGASYVSVFNIAWYGLQPLPFGKRDITSEPSLNDGIHFLGYREGIPGIQPERMGPYCSTFNPGYDPTLPLYRTWPMFDAIKAANASGGSAWSKWTTMPGTAVRESVKPEKEYQTILFFGKNDSPVKRIFEEHGVVFSEKIQSGSALIIADGNTAPSAKDLEMLGKQIKQGADFWLWCPVPETVDAYNKLLPAVLELDKRRASSFIPEPVSWMRNMVNSDFYFCEIQQEEVSGYGLNGPFADEGMVLLNACNTNWRKWNKRPEELKTAAVLRSENEMKGSSAAFVKFHEECSAFYVSTLSSFASTTKGYGVMEKLLAGAGIPAEGKKMSETLIDAEGKLDIRYLPSTQQDNRTRYTFRVWSPRPLDDLLIEPDMPKLDIYLTPTEGNEIRINNTPLEKTGAGYQNIPLKQGWNRISISIPNNNRNNLSIRFACENKPEFIGQLKTAFESMDK